LPHVTGPSYNPGAADSDPSGLGSASRESSDTVAFSYSGKSTRHIVG